MLGWRRRGPSPRAELLICTSLSAGLANATRQLGALCAGKRRDRLASLTGFCENVTFHQTAIYRLLLLLREKGVSVRRRRRRRRGRWRGRLNTKGRPESKTKL